MTYAAIALSAAALLASVSCVFAQVTSGTAPARDMPGEVAVMDSNAAAAPVRTRRVRQVSRTTTLGGPGYPPGATSGIGDGGTRSRSSHSKSN